MSTSISAIRQIPENVSADEGYDEMDVGFAGSAGLKYPRKQATGRAQAQEMSAVFEERSERDSGQSTPEVSDRMMECIHCGPDSIVGTTYTGGFQPPPTESEHTEDARPVLARARSGRQRYMDSPTYPSSPARLDRDHGGSVQINRALGVPA
jgi:hypothetical protein